MTTTSPDRAEYVTCRTLGHSWEQIPVPLSVTPPGGGDVWLWLRCTRCITERHDAVSPFTGAVERRKYDYPDDYHRRRDESMPRDDWRRAYLMLVGISGRRTKPKTRAARPTRPKSATPTRHGRRAKAANGV